MTTKLFVAAVLLTVFSNTAFADDPADTIQTAGRAEIEKVSNFLLFSSSKKFSIAVPSQVSAGDSFDIKYSDDGKVVQERFNVVDISTRGNLCWLHSKRRSREDTSLGDTIYVQPCAKLR